MKAKVELAVACQNVDTKLQHVYKAPHQRLENVLNIKHSKREVNQYMSGIPNKGNRFPSETGGQEAVG